MAMDRSGLPDAAEALTGKVNHTFNKRQDNCLHLRSDQFIWSEGVVMDSLRYKMCV